MWREASSRNFALLLLHGLVLDCRVHRETMLNFPPDWYLVCTPNKEHQSSTTATGNPKYQNLDFGLDINRHQPPQESSSIFQPFLLHSQVPKLLAEQSGRIRFICVLVEFGRYVMINVRRCQFFRYRRRKQSATNHFGNMVFHHGFQLQTPTSSTINIINHQVSPTNGPYTYFFRKIPPVSMLQGTTTP